MSYVTAEGAKAMRAYFKGGAEIGKEMGVLADKAVVRVAMDSGQIFITLEKDGEILGHAPIDRKSIKYFKAEYEEAVRIWRRWLGGGAANGQGHRPVNSVDSGLY